MDEIIKIMKKYKKDRYWYVTAFDVGRELANPDYVRDLEKAIKEYINKHKSE
jgi:hypothetical protein